MGREPEALRSPAIERRTDPNDAASVLRDGVVALTTAPCGVWGFFANESRFRRERKEESPLVDADVDGPGVLGELFVGTLEDKDEMEDEGARCESWLIPDGRRPVGNWETTGRFEGAW